MNFLAMPTLKNVRACFLRPISMMPRFSLKLTLARLRTGIESAGSLLRCAAVITTSATPTSFFSTTPLLFGFFCAIAFPDLLAAFCAGSGLFKIQAHLFCCFGLWSGVVGLLCRFFFALLCKLSLRLRERWQRRFLLFGCSRFRGLTVGLSILR